MSWAESFFTEVARPHVTKREWMTKKVMVRVTPETLDKVIDECIAAGLYALDLETEGLDNRVFNGRTEHKIVGACLSPDGIKGYYLPIRHREGAEHNIPVTQFEAAMRRLIDSPSIAIFHNAKFDQEFLQFCGTTLGEWDDVKKWHDTLILAYLENSRRKNNGLKDLSKTLLECEMIELEELFDEPARKSKRLDFSTLDPTWEPVIWYACSDAICTYNLYHDLYPKVTKPTKGHGGNQNTIYTLEKMCVPSIRWMERSRIPIDVDKVAELIQMGHAEWFACVRDVYGKASEMLGRDIRPGGYRMIMGDMAPEWKFDPQIVNPTYKERLDEANDHAYREGLDPTEPDGHGSTRTATVRKAVPALTDASRMEEVDFPVVYDMNSAQQLGMLFRELHVPGLKVTENSGQIATSAEVLDEVIETAAEQFPFMKSVKRFREVQKALSTYLVPLYADADRRDNTIRVDFHAYRVDTGRFSTKARKDRGSGLHGGTSYNLHSTPATYDPNRPECLARIRECFIARPKRYLAAIDYSGVELRIVTNLSREPLWLTEFFHCSGCDMMFDRGDGSYTPPAPPAKCPRCGSDKIGDLHTLTGLAIYGEEAKNRPDWKQLRQQAKSCNFALCYGGGGSAVMRATGCAKEEGWRIKNKFDKTYKGLANWWESTRQFARKHGYVMTAFGRWYPLPDINHADGFWRSKAERNAVNGPVQGSSADIMKLAMGMLYRECKKRGWLNKVGMLITIHDELVFDIDEDILAEAIDVFSKIMIEDTVSRLKWPVPLTCDIELGKDWTVPWHLGKMRGGEKKWPEELVALFPEARGAAAKPTFEPGGDDDGGDGVGEPPPRVENPAPEQPSTQVAPSPEPEAREPEQEEPAAPVEASISTPEPPSVVVASPPKITQEKSVVSKPNPSVPDLAKGQPYIHRIATRNLSLGLAEKLALVISECRGGGMHPLKIVVKETEEPLWEEEIMINPAQFATLARHFGV